MIHILFVGDPHIRTNNMPEVNLFITRLEELARNKRPDLICIAGDVLDTHERVHTIALNKAYELIDAMRKIAPTFVLVGNHDGINNQIFLSTDHWMNGLKEWKDVIVVDTIINERRGGYHFIFCPYVPVGRFLEALDSNEQDWKQADCIFAHQELRGCKMGVIVSVQGDVWPENYPQVVSGHIHTNQILQKNIYYPGSAMQHAFGDSEKNIIAILSWSNPGEKYEYEEIDLELPKKRTICTDIENMDTYELPKTSDKLRLSISGQYEEFKAFKKTKKYKDIVKTGTKVVFKPKKLDKNVEENIVVDFSHILHSLILEEENTYLNQVYELIINNKIVP